MTHDAPDVLWADAQLVGGDGSYGEFALALVEAAGRGMRLIGGGRMGFERVGFWDEVVVEGASVIAAPPFAAECIASIALRLGDPPPSGSPEGNARGFSTLVVSLSDGARILCTAA